MKLDEDKVDEAALALLYLTLDRTTHRAWKTLDFATMDRLCEKGLILNPVGHTKSVVLTDEGEVMAERLAQKLFGKK